MVQVHNTYLIPDVDHYLSFGPHLKGELNVLYCPKRCLLGDPNSSRVEITFISLSGRVIQSPVFQPVDSTLTLPKSTVILTLEHRRGICILHYLDYWLIIANLSSSVGALTSVPLVLSRLGDCHQLGEIGPQAKITGSVP